MIGNKYLDKLIVTLQIRIIIIIWFKRFVQSLNERSMFKLYSNVSILRNVGFAGPIFVGSISISSENNFCGLTLARTIKWD